MGIIVASLWLIVQHSSVNMSGSFCVCDACQLIYTSQEIILTCRGWPEDHMVCKLNRCLHFWRVNAHSTLHANPTRSLLEVLVTEGFAWWWRECAQQLSCHYSVGCVLVTDRCPLRPRPTEVVKWRAAQSLLTCSILGVEHKAKNVGGGIESNRKPKSNSLYVYTHGNGDFD